MFGRPNQGRFKYACFLDMVQLNVGISDREFRPPAIPQGVSMRKGVFPAEERLTTNMVAAILERMGLQDDGTFSQDREAAPGHREGTDTKKSRGRSPQAPDDQARKRHRQNRNEENPTTTDNKARAKNEGAHTSTPTPGQREPQDGSGGAAENEEENEEGRGR